MTCNQLMILAACYRGSLEREKPFAPATYETDVAYLKWAGLIQRARLVYQGVSKRYVPDEAGNVWMMTDDGNQYIQFCLSTESMKCIAGIE